jgi:hypothetical protein
LVVEAFVVSSVLQEGACWTIQTARRTFLKRIFARITYDAIGLLHDRVLGILSSTAAVAIGSPSTAICVVTSITEGAI